VAGRTGPLTLPARRELGALLVPAQRPHPWPERIPASRFGQLPGDLVATHRPSRCWSSRSTPTSASSSTAGGTRHRSDGSGQSWIRPTSPHPGSPSTKGPGLHRRLRDQTQPHTRRTEQCPCQMPVASRRVAHP
jgi:hypothetical protein